MFDGPTASQCVPGTAGIVCFARARSLTRRSVGASRSGHAARAANQSARRLCSCQRGGRGPFLRTLRNPRTSEPPAFLALAFPVDAPAALAFRRRVFFIAAARAEGATRRRRGGQTQRRQRKRP